MLLKEFRKLKHRDFGNGAVLDEIEKVIEQRDELLAACEAIVAADDLDPRTWESLCGASIAYSNAFKLARDAIAKATGTFSPHGEN